MNIKIGHQNVKVPLLKYSGYFLVFIFVVLPVLAGPTHEFKDTKTNEYCKWTSGGIGNPGFGIDFNKIHCSCQPFTTWQLLGMIDSRENWDGKHHGVCKENNKK